MGKTTVRKPQNKQYYQKNKQQIDKREKDHNKKVKKDMNKLKAIGAMKKRSSQNIELPNLQPFKKYVIDTLERKKKEKDLDKLQNKEKHMDIDFETAASNDAVYEDNKLKAMGNQINDEYDGISLNEASTIIKEGKKYYREMKKVLEAADIILEVLDARDPDSCRCRRIEAEAQAMSGNKKIILVLNKIDLIPTGNAEAWLKVLRREYATVLFKGNTQNQKDNLSGNQIFKKSLSEREDLTQDLMSSSKSVGADKLLELIKNYSKSEGTKTAVTVGVIGYPNVGKSSLINSQPNFDTRHNDRQLNEFYDRLKRSRACSVSSTAGHTKSLQEVTIDSKVKIIDCPGVIFDDENSKTSTLLRNIVKPEQIEDPIAPVDEIIKKIPKNDLLLLYKISDFKNVTEFLCNLALAKGKVKKGGAPNLDIAARMVIQDWNSGKIKYFTVPPQQIASDIQVINPGNMITEETEEAEMDQE